MRYYSVSRLDTYSRCSEYYRRFYVAGEKVETSTVATVAGNYIHSALEAYYEPQGLFDRGVDPTLLLSGEWHATLVNLFAPHGRWGQTEAPMQGVLERLRDDYLLMRHKASAVYDGHDAIRNSKGMPSTQPEKTTAWAKMADHLRLPQRQKRVDAMAAEKDKLWAKVSITEAFTESFIILDNYRDSLSEWEILEVELPISDERNGEIINPVKLPKGEYFKGYIDIVARHRKTGQIGIIDHKSSRGEPPTRNKVAHWDQMLMYAWAYHQLFGEYPEVLGLHYVRAKKLVTAPFSVTLMEKTLRMEGKRIEAIEKEVWIPRSPVEYNTPCYNAYSGEPCPYLIHCHPEFSRGLA